MSLSFALFWTTSVLLVVFMLVLWAYARSRSSRRLPRDFDFTWHKRMESK